jgi:hypothetical protein
MQVTWRKASRVGDGVTGIPDPRMPSGMGLDPFPSIYRRRRKIWDRGGTSPIPDKVLGSVHRLSDLVGDGAFPIPIPHRRPVIGRGCQYHPRRSSTIFDGEQVSGIHVAPSDIPDPSRIQGSKNSWAMNSCAILHIYIAKIGSGH